MRTFFVYIFALITITCPSSLNACAVCFGAPDDPMTKGMQWGIASLLFILVPVLGGVGSFFVFLSRRGKEYAALQDPELFKD
ncbi:MAG: hypothetical protein VX961_03890 [Verrucomicrobiota bacterium]|nr:hypothetical protein [Verrucomicrobiota bacterium]MED5453651.1 hypothetical protein [Verrucomicrobiota bacterium]|tara:strand:+ start:77 stop:322 length:246 start_codon:yes stop_codon:yes gene_type:complete